MWVWRLSEGRARAALAQTAGPQAEPRRKPTAGESQAPQGPSGGAVYVRPVLVLVVRVLVAGGLVVLVAGWQVRAGLVDVLSSVPR